MCEQGAREAVSGSSWEYAAIGSLPPVRFDEETDPGARAVSWADWKWEFTMGVAKFKDPRGAERMLEKILRAWSSAASPDNADGRWMFDHGCHSTAVWIERGALVMFDVATVETPRDTSRTAEFIHGSLLAKYVLSHSGKRIDKRTIKEEQE